MTEDEWFTCTDPEKMLGFLGGRPSERRLRLFACACGRREEDPEAYGVEGERELWDVLALAERYADGQASLGELRGAEPCRWEESCTWAVANSDAAESARFFAQVPGTVGSEAERVAVSTILRDIIGNPFRSLAVDPFWRTPATFALAQAAYDDRILPAGTLDPARLAVLADALEEAGAGGAILDHLRGPGPHYRGCHVVDAILGRRACDEGGVPSLISSCNGRAAAGGDGRRPPARSW
jgi:hypothetical protein